MTLPDPNISIKNRTIKSRNDMAIFGKLETNLYSRICTVKNSYRKILNL